MRIKIALASFLCSLSTISAAGVPAPRVPEPETLSLLAIGVIALIVANLRGRK